MDAEPEPLAPQLGKLRMSLTLWLDRAHGPLVGEFAAGSPLELVWGSLWAALDEFERAARVIAEAAGVPLEGSGGP